ncbi:hypothetical protein L6452_18269 [Arctium lappa]|uniref:Uncharacterized protein n=1 Tax=Arctium lappa TaxID=4217 RepID=A0ACB9C5R4_ARCLA|nr:hypothetical protein L6452_18269 [Arctium lappa]
MLSVKLPLQPPYPQVPVQLPFQKLIMLQLPSQKDFSLSKLSGKYHGGDPRFLYSGFKPERSAKRERARRRKGQRLRPNGNEQGRNDKMRCPGHPHLEGRVEVFGPVALPVPPSSGGPCVGGAPQEIGLEALTLPTSRQLMVVGHNYYKKAPMKMNISHGGVCIFMLGVLLSCDPAAYVRRVAHASYLFRAGGVNSDSIRVFNPVAEMLS